MAEKKFRPNEELKELFEAGALNDIKLLFSGFDIQNQEVNHSFSIFFHFFSLFPFPFFKSGH